MNNNNDTDDDRAFSSSPARDANTGTNGRDGSFKKIAVKRDNETVEITG